MREKWDKAINEIDEKFINETALTYAKNAGKQQELEKYEAEASRPLEFKPLNEQKKSNKAKIIGFSAAAAAVLAVGIGGGVMLSRGNGNDLLVTDTPTIEAVTLGKAFDAADYNFINCVNGENEMQLTDAMINELSEILGRADALAQYDIEGAASGTLAYLYMYPSTSGATEFLRVHELSGKYYYSITRDGDEDNRAYFEMTEDNYTDLIFWFYDYTPECIVGTVIEKDDNGNTTDPDNGRYLIDDNEGGLYLIHYDERFEIGDTVRVYYYGDIMESYPAQIMTYKIEKENADVVTVRTAFAYGDRYLNLDYIPVETETGLRITEPVLYATDLDGNEVVRVDEEVRMHFLQDVEIPKGSRIFLREVQLDSGNAFAVMVPENVDGKKVYHSTFFLLYDDSYLYEFGDAFCPVLSDTTIYYPEAEDMITVVMADGSAQSYKFDCVEMSVTSAPDTVADVGYNYIYFDKADDSFDGMSIAVAYFFGKWGNEDEVLKIGFYESPFTSKDPLVGCYKDDKGYFMLGESRAWYIPKDDADMLYYFDNITDGQRIDTESCTASYQGLQLAINNGVYGGNGEMGYLALLEMCYNVDSGDPPIDVSDFFDMEITDENGTRWVRTADRNVDWGGVYEININGESAYGLKMQNADDPSEFRYFSFFLSVENGKLAWTDEHYCLDFSVCDIRELPTEFAEQSETEATQHGHGYFVVEPYFYTLADGSYYAERVMGNNQAQWLSDTEIFYNDGSGYQLVNDAFNGTDTHSIGDKLYVVHNTEKGIGLSIYSGTELVDSMEIANDGQIVQMVTWAEVYGNYLVIEYYDSTKLKNVYAVVNGTTLSVVYYDSLRFNDDGTVDFPEG